MANPKRVKMDEKQQYFVKCGELDVGCGEIVAIVPEALDGKWDDDNTEDRVADLAKVGQALSLATGGDGRFSVYAVYEAGQRDNLPREYRITIRDDPYEERQTTSEDLKELLAFNKKQ
jgi:hypothetical protein